LSYTRIGGTTTETLCGCPARIDGGWQDKAACFLADAEFAALDSAAQIGKVRTKQLPDRKC